MLALALASRALLLRCWRWLNWRLWQDRRLLLSMQPGDLGLNVATHILQILKPLLRLFLLQ